VRQKERHVLAGQTIFFQNLDRHVRHFLYGEFEHLLPFLIDVVLPVPNGFEACRAAAASRFLLQVLAPGAVHAMDEIQNPVAILGAGFQKDCARRIPEQYAGIAVLVIDNTAHDIAADYEHLFITSGFDHLHPCGERKDES